MPTGYRKGDLTNSRPDTPRAQCKPTPRWIGWAAGFLEGEGSFTGRPIGRREYRVNATQIIREPLEQLQRLFGGRIITRPHSTWGKEPIYEWAAFGGRARGIMLTLYAMLSERRRAQIRRTFDRADAIERERLRKQTAVPTHCIRGHELTPKNLYRWRDEYRCRQCGREVMRMRDTEQFRFLQWCKDPAKVARGAHAPT